MTANRSVRFSGLAGSAAGLVIILARVPQIGLFGGAPLSVHANPDLFGPLLGIPSLIAGVGSLLAVAGLYL